MSRAVFFWAILFLMALSSCSNIDGSGAKAGSKAGKQPAAVSSGNAGIAAALKEKVLPAYKTSTIGNAFEGYRYFRSTAWQETRLSSGKTYVDFIGWVSDPSSAGGKGVEIKFAVNPDGEFYVAMISKVEKQSGGVIRMPLEKKKEILDSIYGNREMSL